MLEMQYLVSLAERLMLWNVWTGIILIVIGAFFCIMAKRLARLIRNQDVVSANDGVLRTFRILGIILIVAGIILMIIQ